MEKQNSTFLRRYLLFSFAIAWVFQILASICALNNLNYLFSPLLAISMFAPLVAVWFCFRSLNPNKTGIVLKPTFKGKVVWWLLSWTLPLILIILGATAYFISLPNRFDPTASSYLINTMGQEAYTQSVGSMSTPVFVFINIISVLFGGILNTFFAIGEEVGWRGYMTPVFKNKYGKVKGRIISGLIWGIWHWPVMFLAGYEYGWSIFNSPVVQVLLGMIMFCLFTVCFGVVLDWLYEKTGSVWAAALAHGILNGGAALGLMMTKFEYASETALGPTPIGLIAILPTVFLVIIILIRND